MAATITCGETGFRLHLESLPEGAVAGQARTPLSCPIAEYLRAQGADNCAVAQRNYLVGYHAPDENGWYRYHHESRRTPTWAARFIRRVDGHGHYITREMALDALRKES